MSGIDRWATRVWPSSSTCRVVTRMAAASSVSTCTTRGCTGAPAPTSGTPRASRWSTTGLSRSPHRGKTAASTAWVASWATARSGSSSGCATSSIDRPGGVELLGEAVEHGEGERVVEGVAQRTLDDDGDGAHPALPQRRRERVGPGIREVGRRGAHPLGRGRGHRALAAEDQGCRRRRHPGPARDVAQGRPAGRGRLTAGGHGRHNIESIRSNRFDPVPGVEHAPVHFDTRRGTRVVRHPRPDQHDADDLARARHQRPHGGLRDLHPRRVSSSPRGPRGSPTPSTPST